jgi:sugar transferase (PEP-CTERM/EpsH1 system associated)
MTEPVHVLCLLHSLGRGGTENGVVNLLNRADPDRFRFSLVLMERDRTMLARVDRPGLEVHTVGRRWGNDPLFPLKLASLFRRLRPDVVHTRGFSCVEGIPAARLAGVKAVVHGEHGRDADEAEKMKPRRAAARSLFFKMADAVVTVSDELRRSLLANVRVPEDKIVRIPNGVDPDRFRSAPDRRLARRKLGLPTNARIVGSVGRLDPVKDYGTLLRAFARVHASQPQTWLVLAGDGSDGPMLRALARELRIEDRVRFLGFRDDVPEILAALDVFALTSLTEGMSNSLLEAMGSGLPCVATRVGGNEEIVVEGMTGLLVPPKDAESLSAALSYVAADPALCELLGSTGRRRVESEFGLPTMVARYESLWESVAARRGIPAGIETMVASPSAPARLTRKLRPVPTR